MVLICISYLSHAQIVTVINKKTKEPLNQVTLINKELAIYSITNSKGQADISKFNEISTLIEIRALGFKSVKLSFTDIVTNSYVITLSPAAITMDEVVISASRWNQSTSDIPSKVMTISKSQINLQNPQTTADLLNVSGKVFVQKSQQGGGSPMIRGFATNRLLYTVDGVRMNTAIFRGGNIQNVISLDAFAIDRTEVLFGPASVIYGSDAIGGIMSFQTLRPQLSLNDETLIAGKANTRFSSANSEKTFHFDVNLGWEKWGLITSLTYTDFDDLMMGSKGPDEYLRPFYVERIGDEDVIVGNSNQKLQRPSGYTQTNLMQKVRFKPNEEWDFDYGFHYSETSTYARYDRHIRYKDGGPRYGEWNYGPQKWMMNNLAIDHTKVTPFYNEMTIRLAIQNFEESRISRDFNSVDRETRTEKVTALSANVDFTKSFTQKDKLFYGLEVVTNMVDSKGINTDIATNVSQKGPSRYPQATWESYALYASNQYSVTDKTTLQAGLRYNFYKLDAEFDTTFYPFDFNEANLSNGSLTGNLGIVHRPNLNWMLSSNFSTAFRSPNVDDVGKIFDSEPGSVVVPNPNLEAEYAYNLDVGIAKIFNNVVKVDATGYYTHLKNAMVRRDFTLNGESQIMYDGELSDVQAIQNAAVAKVYGVQAGVEVKLPSNFVFATDLNFQKGEEELDDGSTSPSRHAAPWFGVSKLTYAANKLQLQVSANYSGEKSFEDMPEEEKGKAYIYATDKNGNPYAPGWATINFKTSYQFTDKFTVNAGIENLTDQRYRPYSSGIVAAGRNFVISLRAVI